MIVSFPSTVRDRLEAIEAEEGVPVLEQVVQAISIWSHLRGEAERRTIGFAVMRTVVYRGVSTER